MRDYDLAINEKDGYSHDRLIYPPTSNLSTKTLQFLCLLYTLQSSTHISMEGPLSVISHLASNPMVGQGRDLPIDQYEQRELFLPILQALNQNCISDTTKHSLHGPIPD